MTKAARDLLAAVNGGIKSEVNPNGLNGAGTSRTFVAALNAMAAVGNEVAALADQTAAATDAATTAANQVVAAAVDFAAANNQFEVLRDAAIDAAASVQRGVAGGVAALDETGKVPAAQMGPPAAHGHAVADVAGLQGALDGKAATNLTNVSNIDFANKASSAGIGGGGVTLKSQGVTVAAAAPTLNFVGGGVAAAADGTVTIPGATASTNILNSGDKAASITLSNGNRTAQSSSNAGGAVRGFPLPSSGKYYWEFFVQQYNAQIGLGVATSAFNINGSVAFHAHSWGVYFGIAGGATGWKRIYGNGSYLGDLGMAIAVNSTVGFNVDFTAGALWVAINGVWQNGGNPLSGASPLISGLPAGLYPALSLSSEGSPTEIVQFRASASTWVYGPPPGSSSLP